MRARVQATIERPIEQVFDLVADPRNDPRWCPHVRTVRQVRGDGPAPGARYAAVHDPMGRPVDLTYEILTLDPPHRLVLEQDDHLGTFVTTLQLERIDEASTRLTQSSDLRFKGAVRLLAPVIRWFVVRGNREQFRRLDGVLEGAGRADPRAS